MLSTWHKEDWGPKSDPFSSFRDMEAEMEELRMLTRVTHLRQQIECRQEGAWVGQKQETTPNGTRRITSFARASRSFVRSVSQDVHFDSAFRPFTREKRVIVEHPEDQVPVKKPDTIEIVDVTEAETEEKNNVPNKPSPVKKTSVVTLGKGNIVLIDPEEETIRVTAIGKVAEPEKVERKGKRVEFCKTEVHFAPESGKINIVETDEKPPPAQIFRRKRRAREKEPASDLPKTYFGVPKPELLAIEDLQKPVTGGINIRMDSPKQREIGRSTKFSVKLENNGMKSKVKIGADADIIKINNSLKSDKVSPKLNGNINNYLSNRKDLTLRLQPIKIPITVTNTVKTEDILGNVSPKLKNLIQNSEFRRKEVATTKDVNLVRNRSKLASPVPSVKSTSSVRSSSSKVETKPRPRPSSRTSDCSKTTNTPRNTATRLNTSTKAHAKTGAGKTDTTTKEAPKPRTVRPAPRAPKPAPRNNLAAKPKPAEAKTESSVKLEKLIRNTVRETKTSKQREAVRIPRTREPLKSFEKVSNGWVGMLPAKTPPKPASRTTTNTGAGRSEGLRSVSLVKETAKERSRVTGTVTVTGRPRPRLDSEQSDDSLVRADAEVRAYMYTTTVKVRYGRGLVTAVTDDG